MEGCPHCQNKSIVDFEIQEFNLKEVTARITCENGHTYGQIYTYG